MSDQCTCVYALNLKTGEKRRCAPEPDCPVDHRSAAPEGNSFADEAQLVYEDSYAVLLDKHRDYGPDNIARAPGGPLMGLAVRLHDKVARLAHLLENGATPENESLADTFLDITNYGAIGQMVLDGTWPGVTGAKSAGVEK